MVTDKYFASRGTNFLHAFVVDMSLNGRGFPLGFLKRAKNLVKNIQTNEPDVKKTPYHQ